MRFLFVDRIVELSPGQVTRGIKHVTADDAFLTTEQGRPCFIPSLIGETLGQLAAWNVMQANGFSQRPVAGVVARASMHRPAYVGETLLLESFIENLDDRAVQYSSIARVGDETVFCIEGALGPLLPMTDFILIDEVKRQFAEIDEPGDWEAVCRACLSPAEDYPLSPMGLPGLSMTFDRICASEPAVSLIAEKRITRAAPYFPDHFPLNPVLPMTVLLECKLNLARQFIALAGYSEQYLVSELRKIKMNEFIHPGEIVICRVTVKRQTEDELILSFRSEVAGKRVCVADLVLIPRGK